MFLKKKIEQNKLRLTKEKIILFEKSCLIYQETPNLILQSGGELENISDNSDFFN
jgi:hypothetical protein